MHANMGFNDTVQLQAWSLVADVGGTNARLPLSI